MPSLFNLGSEDFQQLSVYFNSELALRQSATYDLAHEQQTWKTHKG